MATQACHSDHLHLQHPYSLYGDSGLLFPHFHLHKRLRLHPPLHPGCHYGLIAISHIFHRVSEICGGKFEWKIKVRVLTMWEARDYKKPEIVNSIELLLVDEEHTKIHATINRAQIAQFGETLCEGHVYVIQNFMVQQPRGNFRVTKHSFKITLLSTSKVDNATSGVIPTSKFDFAPFPEVQTNATGPYLLDIIGHMVEKGNLIESEKDGKTIRHIDVVLYDLKGNKLECTLWGLYADQMVAYFNHDGNEESPVMILHQCRRKDFQKVIGVTNYYNATKILINPDVHDATEYKKRLQSLDVPVSQGITQMPTQVKLSLEDEFLQTPAMTISDLCYCIKPCTVCIYAKVIEINYDNGWSYDSCTRCLKKVESVGNKYYCSICSSIVKSIKRYKLHVYAIDGTGSASFVLFDGPLKPFIGKTAADLHAAVPEIPEGHGYPIELSSVVGEHFLMQIDVTEKNVDNNWQTYTVKKLSHDPELISKYKIQHNIEDIERKIDDATQTADNQENIVQLETDNGPSTQVCGKRGPDDAELILLGEDGGSEPPLLKKDSKRVFIKVEPKSK